LSKRWGDQNAYISVGSVGYCDVAIGVNKSNPNAEKDCDNKYYGMLV
jgi:hypothetical protein